MMSALVQLCPQGVVEQTLTNRFFPFPPFSPQFIALTLQCATEAVNSVPTYHNCAVVNFELHLQMCVISTFYIKVPQLICH